jgi:hypothetical protein
MSDQFQYPSKSVLGGMSSAATAPGAVPSSPDAMGGEGPAPPAGPVPTDPMAAAQHHMKHAVHHMGRVAHHLSRAGKGGKKK